MDSTTISLAIAESAAKVIKLFKISKQSNTDIIFLICFSQNDGLCFILATK
jgi:hypothetical protein